MPSYAILGATGATGSSILNQLKQSPQNEINVYVRSKSKLEGMFPQITTEPNVHIFEGPMNDTQLLQSCISGVSTVFSVVATNVNVPGLTLAEDTARALVEELRKLRQEKPGTRLPRIIVLSSATINDRLSRNMPWILRKLVYTAFKHIYDDLVRAEALYRRNSEWLNVVFIQPGGLVEDEQIGHVVSLDEAGDLLSYPDLAAGMIEVANEGDKYDWKGVAISPKGSGARFQLGPLRNFLHGMCLSLFPWLHGLI